MSLPCGDAPFPAGRSVVVAAPGGPARGHVLQGRRGQEGRPALPQRCRCCRCGTSSCSRTWWCRSSSGREKSIAALDEAMGKDKHIFLAAQKKAKTNEPAPEDIFPVGTLGTHHPAPAAARRHREGARRGQAPRAHAPARSSTEKYFRVEVEELAETPSADVEIEALMRSGAGHLRDLRQAQQADPAGDADERADHRRSGRLADTIVAHLPLKLQDKQAILETESPRARLEKLYELMQGEIEILQVEKKIRTRVKKQMEKTQKEYYLNEQMQAIQKELRRARRVQERDPGARGEDQDKRMSKEATVKVKKELKKLKMMSPMSAEATVVRNYIDWILALPWAEHDRGQARRRRGRADPRRGPLRPAEVKERILEYLAVQALVEKHQGPHPLLRRARPASARPRSPSPSPAPRAASSCASASAACATRPRSAATGAPTSARCPARSSSR